MPRPGRSSSRRGLPYDSAHPAPPQPTPNIRPVTAPDLDNAGRAEATFRAITAPRLYSRRMRLFGRRRWLVWRHYEHLWPYADAWSATCTLSSLEQWRRDRDRPASSSLPSFFDGLAAYHRSHAAALGGSEPVGFESSVVAPLGRGGDVFYDDNAWLALALIAHHQLRGDGQALALARRLLAFVCSGWSSEPSWHHPGGIRWKEVASNTSRNTCSNGPVAEVAALVHLHTGDPEARTWARRIYEWVRSTLLDAHDLYVDRVAPDGTLASTIWSYNQGTMIGAGVLLHRITGEEQYLEQATATAAASLDRFSVQALTTQDAAFNAVFFRNLLLLDAAVPDPRVRALLLAYADEMWTRRQARTGLFGSGPSPLNDTAALIEVFALAAGAPPHA